MLKESRLLKASAVLFVRRRVIFSLLWVNALAASCPEVLSQGPVRFAEAAPFSAKATTPERTGVFSVDTQDREAVRSFFNAAFYSGSGISANWTGNLSTCEPGSTSAEYQEAVLTRINFYRAMAGVPADVTFDPEFSAKAAAAALIVSANASITHTPPENFSCFSAEGREGAENSNVALGTAGVDSIEAYMLDAGPNFRVGHRRWLLYPQTRQMGNGDVDPADGSSTRRANANWIFDSNFGGPRPVTRDGFVAWPPPGFVPYKLVYPRWSFSYPGADFTQSTVTVSSNGVQLPVHIEDVEIGYGEESIVFVPGSASPEARMTHGKPAADVTYVINVSNAVVGTVTTSFSYTVTVFAPETSAESALELNGSSRPQVGRTNRFRLSTINNASGYAFRAGELLPYRMVEGADNGSVGVEAAISALYPLIQSNIFKSPPSAFHLAHTTPPRSQSFTLRKIIVPSVRSELRFQSRLGAASTGQFARAQVSLDHGSSWRDVFAQNGDGTSGELNFSQRVVPLQEFAGRAILLRFEYGFPFGSFNYAPGAGDQIGWYLDDIQVTLAHEFVVAEQNSAVSPEFNFVPTTTNTFYLDARPTFFERFGGEWTPGAIVTAVPPSTNPPTVEIKSIQSTDNSLQIEFQASEISGAPQFRIEQAHGMGSTWEIIPENELRLDTSGGTYIYHLQISTEGNRFFRVTVD